jgi:glycosyltransferase involved in cell wall biosynthesis
MTDIAVVIPAHNEERTVAAVIEAFHRELPSAFIAVVDNASTDGTSDAALSALRRCSAQGVLLHEPRRGKGNAVRRALLELDADAYVLVDADLTYPPEQVHDLLHPIERGSADMVVGDRLTAGHYGEGCKRRFHSFGNWMISKLVSLLFGARLADVESGYRALSRSFVKNYPILAEGFDLEPEMTLHALDKRFRVLEVPVAYRERPAGSISKLRTFRDGILVLLTIVKLFRRYRPLAFFGLGSLLAGSFGFLSAIVPLTDWARYGHVHHYALAVVAAGLGVIAPFGLGLGLILDSIEHRQKLEFEQRLLTWHATDQRIGRQRRPLRLSGVR